MIRMSNICPTIRKYEGTKSQKILEMIAEKRREEVRKKLPKLLKDKELGLWLKIVEKKNKELKTAQEKLKKCMNKLNIEKDYSGKFRPASFCDCDKLSHIRLQEAQDYWSLGKHKEAEKIWNAILKHHNLLQNE